MHGAPVTLQVTSPTSRLCSVIVRVVVMRPLISSARTTPLDNRSAAATRLAHVQNLVVRMARSSLNDSEECLRCFRSSAQNRILIHPKPARAADLFVAQGHARLPEAHMGGRLSPLGREPRSRWQELLPLR